MKKIRCALYDRVSTDLQVKDGLSLEAQRYALTNYAISHGYEIVDYYTDEGITSRKNMQNRKELVRLLNNVKADKIDLILVTKLDRWFRNIKDYHNTQAILEAHNCNWKTIFEQSTLLPQTAALLLILFFLLMKMNATVIPSVFVRCLLISTETVIFFPEDMSASGTKLKIKSL